MSSGLSVSGSFITFITLVISYVRSTSVNNFLLIFGLSKPTLIPQYSKESLTTNGFILSPHPISIHFIAKLIGGALIYPNFV